MVVVTGILAAAALLLRAADATGTNDQVNSKVNFGTFQNPSNEIRSRYRYWIPDASVSLTALLNDIKEAVAKGAGGVEFLGYYLYGGTNWGGIGGLAQSDWTTYGWGTPAWKNFQDQALQTTKELGAIIDFPLGPNQGSGVPAKLDSNGLQVDIRPFSVSVPLGGRFTGRLPGWGTGTFISASTGLVKSLNNASSPAVGVLGAASLTDITSQVNSTGGVSLSFSNSTGLYYQVFAYYQIYTRYYEQQTPILEPGVPQSTPTDFLHNGSLVWDHFSTAGAQVAIDFWSSNLLSGGSGKLVKQVGNYFWEDSVEFNPVYAWWTPQLPSLFLAQRGYSISKYLPAILKGVGAGSIPTVYITDESDGGNSYIQDYRQTLTEAYETYLTSITKWSNSVGVQYSAQVGYNLPLDMLALIPFTNAPECESLGFQHNIDAYRQFSGAANLAGKRVISAEQGANPMSGYQLTHASLLWDNKRSFVGGVNQFVFHGLEFGGTYPNTTWPGYSTFVYYFSDHYGIRQPGWDFSKDSYLDYTARTSWVLQSGVPKVDIAFYLKAVNFVLPTQYLPNDLNAASFTYEYLSPDNFDLPAARVSQTLLGANRQGFKALVVRANDTITVQGASRIADFARNGLPVVFSGGIPGTNFWGNNATGAAYVKQTLTQIATLKNVHTVPYTNLAASLIAIGLKPRAQVSATGNWYTRWREDTVKGVTYLFVYNDATGVPYPGGFSAGTVTLATTGNPSFYDAWTGEITPVTVFTQTDSTITIPLQLYGNQTTIIAIKHGSTSKASTSRVPAGSVGVSRISTSNGKSTYDVKSTKDIPSFTLGPWELIVESWSPPADLYNGTTVKRNTTYPSITLAPWRRISTNLTNVSGRGYYTTTFTWPPAGGKAAKGAIIDLGAITHSAALYVNGQKLPALDLTHATADIGAYLKKGQNTVKVVVSTTMANVLAPIWRLLRTSGNGAPGIPVPLQDYGLLYPVVVSPYTTETFAA